MAVQDDIADRIAGFMSGGESTAGPVYYAELSLGWAAPDDLPSLIRRVGSRRPLLVPPVVGKDPAPRVDCALDLRPGLRRGATT